MFQGGDTCRSWDAVYLHELVFSGQIKLRIRVGNFTAYFIIYYKGVADIGKRQFRLVFTGVRLCHGEIVAYESEQCYLLRANASELKGSRAKIEAVAHSKGLKTSCVVHHCKPESVGACNIELHVIFIACVEFSLQLQLPDSICPLAFSLNISSVFRGLI
ncbi:hypothetical protein BMS3Bbin16_00607 [archaeon BMS3Bbin16]|nr:hypothetical protein BMS3Bbin16_00607 [archaeon BMS3Bbin16]